MPRSRSAVAAIARLLDASPQPVYALDEARELVYLNAACGTWLNLDVERLIGQRCDYHSRPPSSPLEAVTCGLCPPPDLFVGSPGLTRIVVPVGGGVESRRNALVTPLLRRGGAAGVLVVVAAEESADDGTTPSDARRLHARLREIRHESRARFHWDRLVGGSTWSQRARDLARLSVEGRANTVVFGPPGTGREHLA
ncbi:MAG TPA: hypothetical protein PLV92_16035, partial [Pirellulaceae bacterium]|nr:hypothetical protein [Pirellulaceae bacterium]